LNTTFCPLCGDIKKTGKTTYTVDIESNVIVVRNVPALICSQCGEEWIESETAVELEELVEDARKNKRQVEIVSL
jgi:YgiT-type zinc finger domain-containing protein